MTQEEQDKLFAIQRLVLAMIAGGCLCVAAFMFFTDADYQKSVAMAMCLRIGCLLTAVWLALPQIRPLQARFSSIVLGVLLCLLILLAARPNLFRVIGSMIVIVSVLAWMSKWVKRLS